MPDLDFYREVRIQLGDFEIEVTDKGELIITLRLGAQSATEVSFLRKIPLEEVIRIHKREILALFRNKIEELEVNNA